MAKHSHLVLDLDTGEIEHLALPVDAGGPSPGAGYLILDFDWTDVAATLLVGLVPVGTLVELTVIDVTDDFDGIVQLEVGRTGAPAELMLGTDSNSKLIARYHVANDKLYTSDTYVYLTFVVTTASTKGSGRVLVYLSQG